MKITDHVVSVWTSVYVNKCTYGDDEHTAFSKQLHIDRGAAKELCYKILYIISRSDIMQNAYTITRKC